MKVLTSAQIREADAHTIKNEPIASIDLMERASKACADAILLNHSEASTFSVFCGIGNNGGDGLAIARLLKEEGETVSVFLVHFSEKQSPDNLVNEQRAIDCGIQIQHVRSSDDLVQLSNGVVIDALVGTGLTRPLDGLLLETVNFINAQNLSCIAIDLPSGFYCEDDTSEILDKCVQANTTLTFQVPKLNLFFPDHYRAVGNWQLLDIGLDQRFIDQAPTETWFVDHGFASRRFLHRALFSHKGTFGHACLVVGSHGKMGAATLSAKACLRAGAGLVTAIVPESEFEIIQTTVPEAMALPVSEFNPNTFDFDAHACIGIGPGLGTNPDAVQLMKSILQKNSKPVVIDADGINILSQHPELMEMVPKNSVLTPHVKEFERLFGACSSGFERFHKQREASKKHEINIVLKGKYSSITSATGEAFFNSTGNPGMATAGSGDVLTGIITGILSQGYTGLDAAILGCYLHGYAGDFVAKKTSQEALIASDIIEHLHVGFRSIQVEQ